MMERTNVKTDDGLRAERKSSKKRTELGKIKFNELMAKENELASSSSRQETDTERAIENEKLMVKVFNSDKTYEFLQEFILNENRVLEDQQIFNKTKYVSHDSHQEFFHKYKNFGEIKRKGLVKNTTPSFAFIGAINKQMLVPNPIGLIKRKGNENQVNLKNQKVGDEYLKALSKGLKYTEHINELNLSANRLTFYGVNPLISSVQENKKLLKRLRVMDLSYNKVGGESINSVIKYIREEDCELKELNLEGNSLGDKVIRHLSDNIADYLPDKIYVLNLGKNLISEDSTAASLANIITNCHCLQVFIVCWNHIKNFGASLIIKELRKHMEMKVFDISWNSIGDNLSQEPVIEEIVRANKGRERNYYNSELNEFRETMQVSFRKYGNTNANDKGKNGGKNGGKNQNPKKSQNSDKAFKNTLIPLPSKQISAFAKELGEYFKEKNIDLVHLDISHNNINYEDAVHLSKEVKNNHTILGMHVDGNEMTVDPLGFLNPAKKGDQKDKNYYANSQIYYKIDKDNNFIRTNVESVRKIRAKNNCWICEGWREMDISFDLPQDIPLNEGHYIKLHLGFENWKAFDTIKNGRSFFNTRMCPPGESHYFFSIDKQAIEDYGESTVHLKERVVYHFDEEYLKEYDNLKLMNAYMNKSQDSVIDEEEDIAFENEKVVIDENSVKVHRVGRINVDPNRRVIDEYFRKNLKYCEPRPERSFNLFVKPRTPWTFPVSIFAFYDYKFEGESEDYIDQLFEFDFTRNFGKEKEASLMELKQILRKPYRKLLECYKYLSAQMGSQIWQINQISLTDFSNSCPGLFDNTYQINDLFLQETSAKQLMIDKDERKKKNKNVPDNLIRHQFMNFLVKVASDKYIRKKTFATLNEAVSYSLNTHFLPIINHYDSHTWRKDKYYNEQVDNFFKAHLPILDAVYKSYAINKDPGKRDVWMALENLTDIAMRLVDPDFPVREIPIIFNISMKLQIDEIHSERIYRMTFPEFLEALARIIDKASPVPPGDAPEDWNKQKRDEQSLVNKLENVLPSLIKSITNPDYKLVKEKFPLPSKERGTGLYTFDYSNPFYNGFEVDTKSSKNLDGKRTGLVSSTNLKKVEQLSSNNLAAK